VPDNFIASLEAELEAKKYEIGNLMTTIATYEDNMRKKNTEL
jgi:hypothetical protein